MPRTSARGGPQTRARILDVANRMFLDRGYESVTVAEVAYAAGVSSVTVFNHFPRKEDLFMDRAADAAELLRAAVRDRGPDVDPLTSLRALSLELADTRHALSGLAEHSPSFLRTVADSPVLLARARAVAGELEAALAAELADDPVFTGDAALLAALFVAGYATVLAETARRLIADEPADTAATHHRARLERLFTLLHKGFDVLV